MHIIIVISNLIFNGSEIYSLLLFPKLHLMEGPNCPTSQKYTLLISCHSSSQRITKRLRIQKNQSQCCNLIFNVRVFLLLYCRPAKSLSNQLLSLNILRKFIHKCLYSLRMQSKRLK